MLSALQEETVEALEAEAAELRQHLEAGRETITRLEGEVEGLQSTDEARAEEMEALGLFLRHPLLLVC